jgi:hypothetical protein
MRWPSGPRRSSLLAVKKRVTIHYSRSHHSESEFTKVEDVCCPYCRKDELWRDTDLSPFEHDKFKMTITSYVCGGCGLLFSLTVNDPDLLEESNRKTLENFRAAPIE